MGCAIAAKPSKTPSSLVQLTKSQAKPQAKSQAKSQAKPQAKPLIGPPGHNHPTQFCPALIHPALIPPSSVPPSSRPHPALIPPSIVAWIAVNTAADRRPWQAAIRHNPHDLDAYRRLAALYLQQGDRTAWAQCYRAIARLDPTSASAQFDWGTCQLKQQNWPGALATYQRVWELDPTLPGLAAALGTCHWQTGDLERSEMFTQQAIALHPNSAELHNNLANCQIARRHIGDAIASYRRALALNPDLAPQIDPIIERYDGAIAAGYAPHLTQGYVLWDAMLWVERRDDASASQGDDASASQGDDVGAMAGAMTGAMTRAMTGAIARQQTPGRPRDRYRLHYLTGPQDAKPNFSVGELHAAVSEDLQTWHYLGPVIQPVGDRDWESGRILAGSIHREGDTYYCFYGGSPPKPRWNHEHIGLATSRDGRHWQRHPAPILRLDPRWYKVEADPDRPKNEGEPFFHCRDAFPLRDRATGRYYLYVTAAARDRHPYLHGCVGLLVGDQLTGPFTCLPPVAAPVIPGTNESWFYELERPQVIRRGDRYHLFFSCARRHVNEKWLATLDGPDINDSTLYWFVSDRPEGPFGPNGDRPIVPGSHATGLYGTQLIETHEGEWIACGHYIFTLTLEVSRRYRVRWEGDRVEILPENWPANLPGNSTENLPGNLPEDSTEKSG